MIPNGSFGRALVVAICLCATAGSSCSSEPKRSDGAGAAGTGGAAGAGAAGTGGAADGYLRNCETLFAARVLEKQIEAEPTFPEDCNEALTANVGALSTANNPLCVSGESPNACRNRLYDTPPRLYDKNTPQVSPELNPGCATTPPAQGCLLGTWLPKCKNGTDTGCAEPEVVCRDGTRPLVYMEQATNAAPSSKWIIFMGGEGGPCSGAKCWFDYKYAHHTGDPEFEKAMSSTHPDHIGYAGITGHGIMEGAVTAGNPFASFNRVKFERCGDAATLRRETVPFGNGIPKAIADKATQQLPVAVETRVSHTDVWHQGFATWTGLFNALATNAGRDRDGDGTPDLPSFANATQVFLVGASDASYWLVYAADRLAAEVRAVAGAKVDVRILIDGYFEPSFDSSGRYHPNAPANFNSLDQPYNVTGLCSLPDNNDGIANETCSDLNYEPGVGGDVSFRDDLDARGVLLDESCEAMHGANSPVCYDKQHTLFHHVATPFLAVAGQEDHTILDARPYHANERSYHWENAAAYRFALLDMTRDVAARWATAAREEGAGTPGDAVLILPKSAQHVRFGDNAEMVKEMTLCSGAGTKIGGASFGAAIGAWADGTLPAFFVFEDGPAWNGTSQYWVTGGNCKKPE